MLAGILISLIVGQASLSSTAMAAVSQPIHTVLIQNLAVKSVADELDYPAQVESKVNATVLAEMDGVVTRIRKSLGAKVRAGETIIVMKHNDPVYQYAPLKVLAPVTGIVNEVDVTKGALVTKGTKVAVLTNPQQLRAIIQVVPADIPLLHKGLTGELTFSNQSKPVAVRVSGMSPMMDPATGTATAQLDFVHATDLARLAAGQVGQVRFQVHQHQALVIPQSALVYRNDDTYVRLVQKGVCHEVKVQVGATRGDNVEILKGLQAGQKLITSANGFVSDGEKVKVESRHE